MGSSSSPPRVRGLTLHWLQNRSAAAGTCSAVHAMPWRCGIGPPCPVTGVEQERALLQQRQLGGLQQERFVAGLTARGPSCVTFPEPWTPPARPESSSPAKWSSSPLTPPMLSHASSHLLISVGSPAGQGGRRGGVSASPVPSP